MPEYLKNTNLQELKDSYMDNHGFVINSRLSVSDKHIEILAETIKNAGVSRDLPILVSRNGENTVFVYENLDAPELFKRAAIFNQLGVGTIIPLLFFLKQIN